ncbi:ATP-binding cassette domain-containing protein [Paenibacillus abyssi]|uniref:Energy-coupling factor transporter ATP-binding protein EcfA1 n=1 Tax=Paenibacillus abyssi TaxID=1340531 RepID=A0A917D4R3_9BACL|nr:ATP-binding cassette domain-containing protein [Paenibacillus abyssi]GGG11716.1 energy-coupling factor transporter ATP-binding protein EcfA1 [Paenibacillus abyssi]
MEEVGEILLSTDDLRVEQASVIAVEPLSGKEITLLNGVTFHIAPGDWVQVVGANGSGKSTLIKLLTGHLGMTCRLEGTVHRGFVGEGPIPYVMQHPEAAIVGATPWEDVLIGLEQQGVQEALIGARLEKALQLARLEHIQHRQVTSLSGGQKQLTALAGCIAAEAPLLILDEATSMLDPESRELVLKAVRHLNQLGRAVIWVTHRLEEWEAEDRIVVLDEGEIIYDGHVDGFYEQPNEKDKSICERLGWQPPYVVETALHLRALGYALTPLPLTTEELARAVSAWR